MLFQIWASFSFHIQYSKYGYVCTKYVITVSTDLLPTASTYNSNILSALSLLIVMKIFRSNKIVPCLYELHYKTECTKNILDAYNVN